MSALGQEAAALSRAARLSGLKRIVSRDSVKRALADGGGGRTACSRVGDEFMVWFVLAMALFCRDCYRQVFRWLRPWDKKSGVPGRSTLCEARLRLGVAPLVRLAARVVKPLAVKQTPGAGQTPGAFYKGMRLTAVDGFVVDLPDTPENERVFGRPGGRAPGAFPQARVVGLCEAGTRVMFKWLVKPMTTAEQPMADYLLKRWLAELGESGEGALLLWDRNFFSYERVKLVAASKAHLLARVKSGLILDPTRRLSDGSYLAKVYPNARARKHDRDGIEVRVIDYTFDDPGRPGTGVKHRLLTTLLDEKAHPAKELVELYHVRWEQELAIGDVKTRQMERPTLRSRTPAGVVQELYALMIGHFVVRSLLAEAAEARPEPAAPAALSFTAALKILRCRLPECPLDPRQPAGRRRWYRRLVEEIAAEPLEPRRRNRVNPRVIKRKMSNWKKKRPEHRNYPQPTKDFCESIVMTC